MFDDVFRWLNSPTPIWMTFIHLWFLFKLLDIIHDYARTMGTAFANDVEAIKADLSQLVGRDDDDDD